MDNLVVPDVRIQHPLAEFVFATREKVTGQLVLAVLFKYVDARDKGASSHLRRVVLHETRVRQRALEDLEAQLEHARVLVIVEDTQIPLERRDRALEVEVEAELLEDLRLELDKALLVDVVLFLIGKETDHTREAGRDRLLELCGHQNADGRQKDDLFSREVLDADRSDVLVKDGRGHKEALRLVTLLLVQVTDALHPVDTVFIAHHGIGYLRSGDRVVSPRKLGLELA